MGRVPFCVTRKEPKSDRGPLPVSTLPTAVLTVIAPRPPLRGTPSCFLGAFVRRAKPGQAGSSCLGDTGPFVVAKSALFRTPKHGHPSCRFLAPPLPTKPASLGFGGDPPIKCLRCTDTAYSGRARAAGPPATTAAPNRKAGSRRCTLEQSTFKF